MAGRPTSRAGPNRRREAAVLAAIHSFRRAFAEFNRRISAVSGLSVSMADILTLQYVAHNDDATPGGIAAFSGLTSGSVTPLLDRLEAAGFVTRKRSTRDRRVVVVELVPGARQKLVAVMLEAHGEVGKMFDGWSVEDVESLVGLMERLNPARSNAP